MLPRAVCALQAAQRLVVPLEWRHGHLNYNNTAKGNRKVVVYAGIKRGLGCTSQPSLWMHEREVPT